MPRCPLADAGQKKEHIFRASRCKLLEIARIHRFRVTSGRAFPMISKAKDLLTRNLGGAVPVIFGTSFAQILIIVVSPIIARIYTPEDMGVFGIFSAWFAIMASFITLRYEDTIPISRSLGEAHALKRLSVIFTIILSLGWLIVLLIVDVARPEGLTHWVMWLLPVGTLAAGYYAVYNGLAIRKQNYAAIGRATATKGWGQVLTQLFTPLIYPGPLGLVIGRIMERAAGIITLRKRVRLTSDELKDEEIPPLRSVAGKYVNFARFASPATLINTVGSQVIPLLLGGYYGLVVLGIFMMANRILVTPIQMLATAVSQTFFGDMSEAYRSDPTSMKKKYIETSLVLLGISTIMALGVGLFAVPVLPWVFGSQWIEIGHYAVALIPMYAMLMVTLPLRQTFLVLDKQRAMLILDVMLLVLGVLGIVVPWSLGYGPLVAVLICSLGQMLSGMCMWLVLYRYVSKA